MKKYKGLPLIVLAALCLTAGCGKKHEKIDVSGSETAAAAETMAESANDTESSAGESVAVDASGSKDKTAAVVAGIYSAAPETYTAGNVSAVYPVLTCAEKSSLTAEQAQKINSLIRQNILDAMEAYGLADGDSLELSYEILSADRSRITVAYTGTLQKTDMTEPINLFLSNTVDLKQAANISLNELADPYTMAGYVVSDDCFFTSPDGTLSEADQKKLKETGRSMTLDQYYDLFRKADFPAEPDETTGFPGTFSYEQDGTIVFSIPVSHELGDYALVAYTPENK